VVVWGGAGGGCGRSGGGSMPPLSPTTCRVFLGSFFLGFFFFGFLWGAVGFFVGFFFVWGFFLFVFFFFFLWFLLSVWLGFWGGVWFGLAAFFFFFCGSKVQAGFRREGGDCVSPRPQPLLSTAPLLVVFPWKTHFFWRPIF